MYGFLYVYHMYAFQNSVSKPLALELQMFVSNHGGAGN